MSTSWVIIEKSTGKAVLETFEQKTAEHIRTIKSSTGTDIECNCMYDTDMSQHEFTENIEIVQHGGYSTTSIGYYIDNGNVAGAGDIEMTVKGTTAAIIAAAKKYTATYNDLVAASGKELEEVKAEIVSVLDDVSLINFALDKLPVIEDLEFVPNKNLIVLTTKGYSQGDYARVIYCPEDLEKCWGNYPKQEEIQKMIDHYYWDAPIYARFEINGEEYNYHDMPAYDEYEWERDKFIDYVAKESGIEKETLEQFVPEYPEYR